MQPTLRLNPGRELKWRGLWDKSTVLPVLTGGAMNSIENLWASRKISNLWQVNTSSILLEWYTNIQRKKLFTTLLNTEIETWKMSNVWQWLGVFKFLQTVMMPIISTGKKIKLKYPISQQTFSKVKSHYILISFDKIYVPVYVSWYRTLST